MLFPIFPDKKGEKILKFTHLIYNTFVILLYLWHESVFYCCFCKPIRHMKPALLFLFHRIPRRADIVLISGIQEE